MQANVQQQKQAGKAPANSQYNSPPGFSQGACHAAKGQNAKQAGHGSTFLQNPVTQQQQQQQENIKPATQATSAYMQRQQQPYAAHPYQPQQFDPTIAQMFMQQQAELQRLAAIVEQQQQHTQLFTGQNAAGPSPAEQFPALPRTEQACSSIQQFSAGQGQQAGRARKGKSRASGGNHNAAVAAASANPASAPAPPAHSFPSLQGATITRRPMRMKKGIPEDELRSYTCPITCEVMILPSANDKQSEELNSMCGVVSPPELVCRSCGTLWLLLMVSLMRDRPFSSGCISTLHLQ